MVRNRDSVLHALQANRKAIREYGVLRLGLFGSCARGKNAPASDLDFVVDFQAKTFDAYMGLKAFLEELFECEVDLVLTDAIKPRLRKPILESVIDVQGL